MLHKFGHKHRNSCIQIFRSFGKQMLVVLDTHDVGLSDSMPQPMKLRCCVLKKGFPSKPLVLAGAAYGAGFSDASSVVVCLSPLTSVLITSDKCACHL